MHVFIFTSINTNKEKGEEANRNLKASWINTELYAIIPCEDPANDGHGMVINFGDGGRSGQIEYFYYTGIENMGAFQIGINYAYTGNPDRVNLIIGTAYTKTFCVFNKTLRFNF